MMDREKVIKKAERIMRSTVDRDMIDSFCMDVIALLKDQEPTVCGWVSVKDRLPEPEENVIIWTKTGCMKYAQYHEDGSVNPWYVYEDNARAWTNVISHWMPLPEPPKEEN